MQGTGVSGEGREDDFVGVFGLLSIGLRRWDRAWMWVTAPGSLHSGPADVEICL